MLSDATLTADIIKEFAKNAVDSTMPFSFHYGTVKSTDPIEIEVEQKLILTENDLIFTTLVQDFDVDMYMEHEVEETDLIHKHDIKIDTLNAGNYPCTSTHTITVQDSPDADKHIHEYKGVKTFTVNLKLAKDEKVLLLRIQGGQKFLVLDRVRTLNDTEFTDEFEGSGSSGSSGSGSSGSGSGSDSGNTSGGGSGGSTDSGGGNSGSTDSGNGGNDSGSTDNENPDTGDNGNNSGGSVSDVISVTALMTALLSLTDEQKKEIGLTGVTIDDENITDSSTWSSQKIQDSVNANTFEISKLNETTELSGECCIPIVQGTETKKIKVDTLQSELNDKINAINDKLPEQATNENKLADKDFVNSSISSNTAYFIGTFNSLSELQASNKTITKNDYAFIVETDDVGNIKYNRYKWNGSEWLFEYALNNSSFTSNQWKTINSNITEEWKNSIETDIETEIAERKSADTSLQNQINNKVDANHTHDDRYYTETEIDAKISNNIGLTKSKEINLSDKSTSNFYPVIITGRNRTAFKEVMITSNGGSASIPYNQNRIHFTISNDGWNDTPKSLFIKEYTCYDNKEITIGCIGYGDKGSQHACIWLRGGIKYTVYTIDCSVSSTGADVIESATDSNYSKFTVGTNYYGGTNSNVTIMFTPQSTITNGIYSNRAITAPNFIGTASKAIADGSGNNIESTYLKKTDIDTSINTESTNPVQNKVVTTKINAITDSVVDLGTRVINLSGQISSLGNKVYTCSTASGTKYKTVSIPNIDTPSIGTHITVVFTNGNSIASPTLGINGTSTDEIRVLSESSILPLTSKWGSTSQGAYQWDGSVVLELYYNGTYWLVINNPIVASKKTCSSGTSSSSPAYKCYLNGWKEIRGYVSIGNVSNRTDLERTFTLPITMSDTTYYVSLSTKHTLSSNANSGEEMTYYGDATTLKIHFYNRNESSTMSNVNLTWMIQGY